MTDINKDLVIRYINYIIENRVSKADSINLIKDNRLTTLDKNVIILYCFPRELGDMELPNRIQEFRNNKNTDKSQEFLLLLEACRTNQYNRFMKHIMHAFLDDLTKLGLYTEKDKTCALSGDSENLYYSTDSSVVICKNCLVNLSRVKDFINELDPGFLDWTKRYEINKTLIN